MARSLFTWELPKPHLPAILINTLSHARCRVGQKRIVIVIFSQSLFHYHFHTGVSKLNTLHIYLHFQWVMAGNPNPNIYAFTQWTWVPFSWPHMINHEAVKSIFSQFLCGFLLTVERKLNLTLPIGVNVFLC